jgi:hypothetical protein
VAMRFTDDHDGDGDGAMARLCNASTQLASTCSRCTNLLIHALHSNAIGLYCYCRYN